MHSRERAELARQAYLQAVERARESSTPASWRRLLAAARNLHAAAGEGEAARAGSRTTAGRGQLHSRAPGAASASPGPGPPTPAAAERDRPARLAGRSAAGAALQPVPRHLRWPGLEADLRRARALHEQSRKLVAQARRLRDELAQLLASMAPSEPSPS